MFLSRYKKFSTNSSMCDTEDGNGNAKEEKYKTYPSRWYILIVYATFACLQVFKNHSYVRV